MKLKTFLLAAGTSLILSGGAYAADLPMAPEIEEAPVAIGSGWYLRGDIGITTQDIDKLENDSFERADKFEFLDEGNFDSSPFFAFGVGYQFNKYLRADITGEYRSKAEFHALDHYVDSYEDEFGDTVTLNGANEYTARKSELTFLANGYIDLFHWKGFTPYIGGGVGFSYNMIEDFKDRGMNYGGPDGATSSLAYGDGDDEFDLAYAAHAGFGYQVAPGLTVDIAYRYINLGDAGTKDVVTYDGADNVGKFKFKDIDSHDVKFGLRWDIDQGSHEAPIR